MGTKKTRKNKTKVKGKGINRERAHNQLMYKRHLVFINGNCLEAAEMNGHHKLNLDDIGVILDTKNLWAAIGFIFYKNHDGLDSYIWKRIDHETPMTRCEVAIANLVLLESMIDSLAALDTVNPYKHISMGYIMSPDHKADLEATIEATVDFLASAGAYDALLCRMIDNKRDIKRKQAGLEDSPMMGDIYQTHGTKVNYGGALSERI